MHSLAPSCALLNADDSISKKIIREKKSPDGVWNTIGLIDEPHA